MLNWILDEIREEGTILNSKQLKAMDVKRAIAELTSQVSEINYDSDEEGLLKGIVINLYSFDILVYFYVLFYGECYLVLSY